MNPADFEKFFQSLLYEKIGRIYAAYEIGGKEVNIALAQTEAFSDEWVGTPMSLYGATDGGYQNKGGHVPDGDPHEADAEALFVVALNDLLRGPEEYARKKQPAQDDFIIFDLSVK
jgi:hypothetical protein